MKRIKFIAEGLLITVALPIVVFAEMNHSKTYSTTQKNEKENSIVKRFDATGKAHAHDCCVLVLPHFVDAF